MNLQQEDRNALYACKSDADWLMALIGIKSRHDGRLPDDWHIQMVVGGLEVSLRENWPKVTEPADFLVDPERMKHGNTTGIFVRAKHEGKWGSYDFATLDKASVLAYLRVRGGDNPWAEDIVGILLGHGHLHTP